MSAASGRIVRIVTFSDAGVASTEYWWAAVDDDAGAVRAVQFAAGALADQGVTVEGVISLGELAAHGLKPGQAAPAPIRR